METYFLEIEKYVNSLKDQVEEEKRDIAQFQKKFPNQASALSQKAPSNSVLNSLFKDEPEGFAFGKNEEKRKQLAEQRRAEYNAFLEKKEAERLSKQRTNEESRSLNSKSLLDSVDYEQVLAKRKEEEAKFRNLNIADILHHSQPILKDSFRKSDSNKVNSLHYNPDLARNGGELPDPNSNFTLGPSSKSMAGEMELPAEKKRSETVDIQILEEKIARYLEKQTRQMLLDFDNELKKDNTVKEEIQNLKSSSSVVSLRDRMESRVEELPKLGRTGGGGEPVRDSYGNLITLRGQRTGDGSSNGSVMLLPSMQQQPIKDRMAIYREELQKQIEEKKRLEALEKAKAEEMELKLAQRMEEQRLKMLEEYENELKKNKRIKDNFQQQEERARKLEEFQRKDAEAKRKRIPEVEAAKPEEPPPPPPAPVAEERSHSPPIPAVRTKVLLEKAVVNAPKVKSENLFSSIAEIRRKINEEQQKSKNNIKPYEVMDRRTVQELSDDEDEDFFKSSVGSSQRFFDST